MLARHEIAPFFILLAVAGNDTTRTAISHGMHLLSQNPDERRRWQADLDVVTPTAVEEIVRVASPVTFMRRTATRHLTVSDQEFVEGDKVVLFYGVANRDPRVFDDPESFDVLPRPESPRGLRRARSALLSRRPPRASRARGRLPSTPHETARHRGHRRTYAARIDGHPARRRHQASSRAVHSDGAARAPKLTRRRLSST